MTSFKFNFDTKKEIVNTTDKHEIEWQPCEHIKLTNQFENLDAITKHAKMFMCGEVEIGQILTNELSLGKENAIELAEKQHSDLIPGKYEGGLKIWECTYDLIDFLEKNKISLEKQSTLDLGCGTGILGIYACLQNALVTFQDYNKEIIEHVTIPNFLLNIEEEDTRQDEIQKHNFYSGDWESFNNVLPKDIKYDVILTSETIYNCDNYDKLIKLFEDRLSQEGVVYVAAKTYYFGVGGGTRQFEMFIKQRGKLQSEAVWTTSSGIQREIIKLYRI